MSKEEERFRDFLQRLGVKCHRQTLQQMLRHEIAANEIFPWIVQNVSSRNMVDPEMIREYEEIQQKISPQITSSPRSSWKSISRWDPLSQTSEQDLIQTKEELDEHLKKRQKQKQSLLHLKQHLEAELEQLETKLNLSYEEEDHLVHDLLNESENKALKACHDLDSRYQCFSDSLAKFSHLMDAQGSSIFFTQSPSQKYWKESRRLTTELERLARDVVSTELIHHQNENGNLSKIDSLLARSQLQNCSWFQELERLKQCKQVSDLSRLHRLLDKSRAEAQSHFLSKYYGDMALLVSDCKDVDLSKVQEECEQLKNKKKKLLNEELPAAVTESLHSFGCHLLKEYIPNICGEWNTLLLKKQQLLDLAASQLDRSRLYKILANVENQQVDEMTQYLKQIGENFKKNAAAIRKREPFYHPPNKPSFEFVDNKDSYLNSVASHLKFCIEKIQADDGINKMEISAAQPKIQKRHYSIAFTPRLTGNDSPGMSPVSKMIKEQRTGIYTSPPRSAHHTPCVRLEESLKRLSMTPGHSDNRASLFHDTSSDEMMNGNSSIPFHGLSLMAARVFTLSTLSHRLIPRQLQQGVMQKIMETEEALDIIHHRIFVPEENHIILSAPSLRSAFEGCDKLIEELNRTSGALKGEFRSFVAFLDRQPIEAKTRNALIKFFI